MTAPTFRFDDPPLDSHDDSPVTRMIDAERARLARVTARGMGMPVAGMLYWLAVGYAMRAWTLESAVLFSWFATGAVFPVGLALTRALGGDLFAKSASFTSLGLLLNAMQLFAWPVVVLVGRTAPAWTPFAMATLFGAHFLGYAWLYRSRGYGVLSVGLGVVLTAAVLVARGPLPTLVPFLAAAVHLVAIVLLWLEHRDGR